LNHASDQLEVKFFIVKTD